MRTAEQHRDPYRIDGTRTGIELGIISEEVGRGMVSGSRSGGAKSVVEGGPGPDCDGGMCNVYCAGTRQEPHAADLGRGRRAAGPYRFSLNRRPPAKER